MVTPLVHLPTLEEEELFSKKGMCSFSCGVFGLVEYTLFEESLLSLTRFNMILTKLHEVITNWAIYLKWDEWKRSFEYRLVEVLSDFDEVVNVSALVKEEGQKGIYKRQI